VSARFSEGQVVFDGPVQGAAELRRAVLADCAAGVAAMEVGS
jgi:hypothetical protein